VRIVVVGGPAAVGDAVVEALRAYADVSRVAGDTRYATAAALSATTFAPGVPVAYLASGSTFPDALAGGAVAALTGGPVLLTERTALPAATADELDRLDPGAVVVLGGTAAVSDGVLGLAGGYCDSVSRVAGPSRFATAAALSAWAFPGGAAAVFVATGAGFADALAGVPAAAAAGAPLLLVERDHLPQPAADELARLRAGRLVVLGGPSAVSEAVVDELAALLVY
jgi:putative cell wall-binding protein